MSNDIEKQPWWGDPKTILWNLGPVTFGFFCLLAILFGWLPSPVLTVTSSSNSMLTSMQGQMSTVIERLVRLESQMKTDKDSVVKALRQICRNTSKHQQDRDSCDELY